jgi:hypothetical protein
MILSLLLCTFIIFEEKEATTEQYSCRSTFILYIFNYKPDLFDNNLFKSGSAAHTRWVSSYHLE